MAEYPDPVMTASINCNRRLNRLVQVSVRHRQAAPSTWSFRYGKCGEHLKIRVRGPPEMTTLSSY